MRDSRADAGYFARYRAGLEVTLSAEEERATQIERATSKPGFYAAGTMALYRARLGEVLWAYSTRLSVAEIAIRVSKLIDSYTYAWVSDAEYLDEATLALRHDLRTSRHIYTDAISVLSLAILTNADTARVDALLQAVGNRGIDGVYDRVARTREPDRLTGNALAFNKPWAKLLSVFDAEASKRPALVKSFLGTWYSSNKSVYWAGDDLIIDRGGIGYGGYWCFEAAAVVRILDIDDSSFKDNPFYPADLVQR